MDELVDLKASFAADMARWLAPESTEEVAVLTNVPAQSAVDQVSVDECLIQLALSGRVSPHGFVGANGRSLVHQNELNRVVDSCAVQIINNEVCWQINQPKRIDILQQLLDAGTLSARLAGSLPATDRFGELLRETLQQGATLSIKNRTADELLALMEALETTRPLALPQPDWAELRRQIGLNNFLNDQRTLLANGFVGRQTELGTLRNFLTDSAPAGPSGWSGLVVTGLGGSGKSTLLAKFADEVVREKLATLVVFDFDRPGLNPDDRLWLESEMARQVGYQYPAVSEQLREDRATSRQQKLTFSDNFDKMSYESVAQERSAGLVGLIHDALVREKADSRPLLLILDTFEEADQQDLTGRMLEWIGSIYSYFYEPRLRVIFSGRLFDNALSQVLMACNNERLDLGELSKPETTALLKRVNVPDELARRVAASTLIPHRPLELKLLARMLKEKGDATLDEIENELRTGGEAARSLFMGLVYRRVLMRISDPIAQKLAYPGLVLRYVTVDLILHVLAPVLKLKLTQTAARAALDALARHTWICYPGSNGEIWHRKDLRRSMLGAMRAHEPELAHQISEAAFAYFSKLDKAKTDARLQAEQTYHRLLWLQQPDEGAAYELATLKSAAEFIGADAIDLPKAAAVLLQYAQKGRVSADEVEYLPAEYFQKAYQKTGQRIVDNREFGKALRLYKRGEKIGETRHIQPLISHQSWELDMLFSTASWEMLDQALDYGDSIADTVGVNRYNYLYYRVLITEKPAGSDDKYVESMNMITSKLFRDKLSKQAISILKKTVIELILINANRSSGWITNKLIVVKGYATKYLSFQDAFHSTHLLRKLLYIDIIARADPTDTLALAPSLLKVDPVWLAGLATQPFMEKQEGEAGKSLRQLLLDARALLTRKTVRRTLDALDILYKNKQDWKVQGSIGTFIRDGQELRRWFRGPDPEFRDPVRFALLDAFRTRNDYRELAGLLASVLALPFTDLEPDAFAEAMVLDPEHFLEPYIELADRNWALGTLLAKTVAARPGAASLLRVKASYDRWDAAVIAAFTNFSPTN